MHPILTALERQPRYAVVALCAIGIVALGAADYLTGWELSFSVFYLLPVATAAWVLGRVAGLLLGALAAVVWLQANLLAGEQYSSATVSYWNTAVRFGFFATLTLVVNALRRSLTALEMALTRERELSRVDPLTGVPNARAFRERLSLEVARATRRGAPLAIAYLDIDHFKRVNDEQGHAAGDELLRAIGETLVSRVRETDAVARVGGDEFAVLLPDTDLASAEHVLGALRERLLARIAAGGWPVTVSIGATVLHGSHATAEALLNEADALMYSVKNTGRNRLELRMTPSVGSLLGSSRR